MSLDRNSGGLLYRLREHKWGMADRQGGSKVYRRLFGVIEEGKRVTPDRVLREAVVVRLYAAEKRVTNERTGARNRH